MDSAFAARSHIPCSSKVVLIFPSKSFKFLMVVLGTVTNSGAIGFSDSRGGLAKENGVFIGLLLSAGLLILPPCSLPGLKGLFRIFKWPFRVLK